MTDRTDGSQQAVNTAAATYDTALTELRRQEVAAMLRARKGLHYASIGEDWIGPNLVTYNGEIVGETRTKSPGTFRDWYAKPIDVSEERGPFPTARAAAASLIKEEETANA